MTDLLQKSVAVAESEPLAALRAQMATVCRPIGEAAGLPNSAYVDDAVARLERDHVLAPTWMPVAFASDLTQAGTLRPIDLMGLPLFVVRDERGAINVFHNVCSHRGQQLVREPCTVRGSIRCPYHAWTYGLDGRLRGTPHIGGVGRHSIDGFDPGTRGLRSVRSHVWLDIVFVNLSGDAPPFDAHIAPLIQRWSRYWGDGPRGITVAADAVLSMDVQANWKLAVENYCEAYHLPWVHPGLNSYSKLEDHYGIAEDDGFAGQGTHAYRPVRAGGVELPPVPGSDPAYKGTAEYVALFPNLLLGAHADHLFAMIVEPVGPSRSREHLRLYFTDAAADATPFASTRAAVLEGWREVFAEDVPVVEGMQRGRASPAFEGGVFSPVMDVPTHCFHKWVAAGLGGGAAKHALDASEYQPVSGESANV